MYYHEPVCFKGFIHTSPAHEVTRLIFSFVLRCFFLCRPWLQASRPPKGQSSVPSKLCEQPAFSRDPARARSSSARPSTRPAGKTRTIKKFGRAAGPEMQSRLTRQRAPMLGSSEAGAAKIVNQQMIGMRALGTGAMQATIAQNGATPLGRNTCRRRRRLLSRPSQLQRSQRQLKRSRPRPTQWSRPRQPQRSRPRPPQRSWHSSHRATCSSFLHSSGGFNAKEVDEADVFVNAVVIRSYSNDDESWACCGLNGAILLEVACHPQTMTLIEKFIDDVAALPAGKLACKVHIQCAAGRHRSVALLTLLCDALITVSGKIVHYVHVSESSRPFCGCPNDCTLVANKAKQKGWDAEKLRNFWFENGNAAICVFRRIWATALKRRSGSLQ